MIAEERKGVISLLKKDEIKNINMLNFMESYPVRSLERIGNSVLLRGVSDCLWVYISSTGERELKDVAERLTEEDRAFAAIEEWMLPLLIRGRAFSWELSMTRLVLPEQVTFPKVLQSRISPLSPDDAEYIYEHSLYQAVTRPEYIRGRIQSGPSAGVRESGKLAAWLMTQDDGSIGLLHVLDDYRGRGYAYDLTADLITRLRERKRIPFVHVEETNTKSMNLALKLGFRRDRRLHWFKITPEDASADSGDYC
ncbi:MAG: GNAT family N-acetyltransferase [Syntrophorhabdales bacterium]|jgi:8-oxo-dGTP diphosphatase